MTESKDPLEQFIDDSAEEQEKRQQAEQDGAQKAVSFLLDLHQETQARYNSLIKMANELLEDLSSNELSDIERHGHLVGLQYARAQITAHDLSTAEAQELLEKINAIIPS